MLLLFSQVHFSKRLVFIKSNPFIFANYLNNINIYGGYLQMEKIALSFYRSKIILDHPIRFGRVQFVLVEPKSFGQVQIYL